MVLGRVKLYLNSAPPNRVGTGYYAPTYKHLTPKRSENRSRTTKVETRGGLSSASLNASWPRCRNLRNLRIVFLLIAALPHHSSLSTFISGTPHATSCRLVACCPSPG